MLTTLDNIDFTNIELGEIITAIIVCAANVVKDIRENIRNLIGGRMLHYENLIQTALSLAIEELEKRAKDKGYDGVLGVRLAHPVVVEGAVEVIAYGTGFKYRDRG